MSPVAINTEKPVRVLPKDVYDTLELAALAFGGIGAGPTFRVGSDANCPNCIHGIAVAVELGKALDYGAIWKFGFNPGVGRISRMLFAAGLSGGSSDSAVYNANERKNRRMDARLTFAEWCAELNVIRGD